MKNSINNLSLTKDYEEALQRAKYELKKKFAVEKLVVFGSVARGENDENSDLDLLVVTNNIMTHRERNAMSDIIFEINYRYSTNISIVIVDSFSWNKGIYSLLPINSEILRDGVVV
jgi:predicted nucleotidyltransferase